MGANFVDPREDYRLIAVVDPLNEVAEASEENNEIAFRGGAFLTPDGTLHVHGGDSSETVKINVAEPPNGSGSGATGSASGISVKIDEWTMDYDADTLQAIHLRLHGSDDVLNVQPQVIHSIHAYGGAGNDRILAGAGSDWLIGGAGDDFIAGRSNRDYIEGNDGDDALLGGADNDTLLGLHGNDKLASGAGRDIVDGGDGADIVDGGQDDDMVYSGRGADRIVNPPGTNDARDAKGEDTLLTATPEELIFAELSAEEEGDSLESESLQNASLMSSSTTETYGYAGFAGPFWLENDGFGNTVYQPEGEQWSFWPFTIKREDTYGPEVDFDLSYGGTATAADFLYQQTTVRVSSAWATGVEIQVYDDATLEGTEDFTAYFSSAVVPSDPGMYIVVDYPSTGQPSTDPDGDPYSATNYIVDGDLEVYDSNYYPVSEADEESPGVFMQVGNLHPLVVGRYDDPTGSLKLIYPSGLAVWRNDDRLELIPSGSEIEASEMFYIEALAPVSHAVVSFESDYSWNAGVLDRVAITAFDLDLDVDSNNNHVIAADDDPIELDLPGKVIHINNNDTNGNGVPDRQDAAPFVDGSGQPVLDDLTEMRMAITAPPNGLDGYDIRFTAPAGGIRLWTGQDHTGEIGPNTVFEIGTDTIPDVLYIEVESANVRPVITMELRNPAGQIVGTDSVVVNIILIDIDGYRADMPYFGRDKVPEAEEGDSGIGIRRNGDNDAQTGEDDLIEVELQMSPSLPAEVGLRYVLFGGPHIKVWETSDKQNLFLDADAGYQQANLTPGVTPNNLWVEWTDMTAVNPSAMLALEVWTVSPHPAANNQLVYADTLEFNPFTSVVVALTGEQWSTQSDPITDSGVYDIAAALRDEGYNVYFADEDEVASEFETTPRGYGTAYNNIVAQIQGNGISSVAMFGHSHGGGSTYDLAWRLDGNRATIGTFTIPFIGYLDAIGNQSNIYVDPDTRRPPGTAFQTNIYQTNGALDGAHAPLADDNFDVTNRPGMTHGDLDDDAFVQEIIMTRVLGKVVR